MEHKMDSMKMPIIPYLMFREWHDPRSGLVTWASPPMLSTGYAAVQNRPALLIATHMLKNYRTRVTANYEMLRLSVEYINRDYQNLVCLTQKADNWVSSAEFRQRPFPLRFQPQKDSSVILFKGKKYSIVKSDLTGGNWFQYSDTNADFPVTWFNKLKPSSEITIPLAYVIPAEYATLVVPWLQNHGIKYNVLEKTFKGEVGTYRFSNVSISSRTSEGRQKVSDFELEEITQEREYLPGSIVIPTDQRTARIICHIFEPKGPDSFISWGYLNAIFEQKEYGESYVLEKLARQMLAADTSLKRRFDEKMKLDKEFASDPEEILNWFYNQSVYHDFRVNLYPFGKILSEKDLTFLE